MDHWKGALFEVRLTARLTTFLLIFVLVFSVVADYPAHAKGSRTYYVHKTSKFYSTSNSAKQSMGLIPINATLKTSSKKSSKMYKVIYSGKTGYVYKSNLWTRRTTVNRYIHKTSYLYTSSNAAKQRVQKIAINKSLTTDSNLNNKMYHVNYKGKRGYVYASNLSTKKTPITKFVVKASKRYKNYAHTKKYSGTIPVNTVLTTTSPQSNKLYWVNYNGVNCYVFASNLANSETSVNESELPINTYGLISDSGNHAVWNMPSGLSGSAEFAQLSQFANGRPQKIIKEATVGSTKWYQVQFTEGTTGWVLQNAFSKTFRELPALWKVSAITNLNAQIYSEPVEDDQFALRDDQSNHVTLEVYATIALNVDQVATIDGQNWVHIKKYTAGTSVGWIKASGNLQADPAPSTATFNYVTRVGIVNGNYPIFNDQNEFITYSKDFLNNSYSVNAEKVINGDMMYRINGIGWISGQALDVPGNLVSASDNSKYKYIDPSNGDFDLFDSNPNDGNALSRDRIASLLDKNYRNKMFEVIDTKSINGVLWDFLKYNDWYEKAGKDVYIGWVRNSSLLTLENKTEQFSADALVQIPGSRNQQGLAYDEQGNYFVSFDEGNGLGRILVYNGKGEQLSDTGIQNFGHTCALSYDKNSHTLYEVNSSGTAPTLNTLKYNPNSHELSLIRSVDLPDVKYIAMIAVKNGNQLIMLSESYSDLDTFYTIDVTSGKNLGTTQIGKLGVVQGMQYYKGTIYFLANNYLTLLDPDTLAISHRYRFSIPKQTPAESEGLTVIGGTDDHVTLAIGFHNHQIYSVDIPADK